MASVIIISSLLLDYIFGETRKFHPLVGFGLLVIALEKRLNNMNSSALIGRLQGSFCWFCLVLPVPILYFVIHEDTLTYHMLDAFVLYLAIGLNSLKQHAKNIYNPLKNDNLPQARSAVAMIVSRQTDELTESEISRATVESILENGHDAVLASLFWFVIGGAPLVIIHRLSNTLDAMWGYKNKRFFNFGWFSAKADDFLGWPSAKVSALFYVLAGTLRLNNILTALQNAKLQGRQYKSLNGGWAMAAGASVLNIKLGGVAVYNSQAIHSVNLGCGNKVKKEDIKACLNLVEKASWLFVLIILIVAVFELVLTKWL